MSACAGVVLSLLALASPADERALTTVIAEAASGAPQAEVVTAADVKHLLELQGQKQAAGCGDDSDACIAELATALGAELVVRGELSTEVGQQRLNLTVLNTTSLGATRRALLQAPSTTTLATEVRQRLPALIAAARTSTPTASTTVRVFVVDVTTIDGTADAPAPPPTSGSWLVPTGGVVLGVGGVGLAVALTAEAVVEGLNASLRAEGTDALDQHTAEQAIADREPWALAGRVGWIVGGAGVVVGGIALTLGLMENE